MQLNNFLIEFAAQRAMGFDYVWAVIQMAKLLLLLSAAQLARSSHRVVLIHPTCELWIWQYDVSLDSYVDLGDFSLLTIRELFATTINAGSNGLFTLKHEFVKPANVLSDTFCTFSGPNAPLALWSNSQNALFVNISSVLNRKKLLLIRDFEFVMSGLSETHWLLIREGDDVSESVAEFISTYAPGLSEEAKRLSFIEMLNEINTSLHNRKNIEDKLKVAAEESVNLQGALNIFVGDTSDRLSHIAGKAWLHFSINTVDLTSADSLLLFTGGISSVNNIVAEHVWEHMTIAESIVAAINCWEALAPGGILRLAVPDYNWAIKPGI